MPNKIPDTLYRGIKLDYKSLQNFKFYGVDIIPYGEPIIDEQGRKLIGDGNEFGIYMSDNLSMVKAAYGNADRIGTVLSPVVRFGYLSQTVFIPNIGICYEIKTEGMDVREPWISSILKGHYNNGFEGREYITDRIPSKNITVIQIQIAPDFLHEEEFIDVSDIKKAEEITRKKLEERKKRLEEVNKYLATLPPQKLRRLDPNDEKILRDIFGENGVKYRSRESIDISNAEGILTDLIFASYHSSPDVLDFKTLTYLEQLKTRLVRAKSNSIDTLLEMIQSDIKTNLENKNAFIERKKEEGEEAITTGFDNKNSHFNNILNQVSALQKKQEQNSEDKRKQMHDSTIKRIEQLLNIKIEPTQGYIVEPGYKAPKIYYKSVTELKDEQLSILQKIDVLVYRDKTLDLGTSTMMKNIILEEYRKMIQEALEREQKYTQENQDISSPKSK